ncbi:MAG TPA: tRNA (adenosine(37)-N6)-dimethylallyltransferase MiaA [Ferruginibacter sp.]|jgi:tRNA dimethylallyltransferase|nr:tRNA (adenosine(37)-N6)-dimethylallyltransferase MiaA [Ferruginibacter sp.]
MSKICIVIVGPTAVGKTNIAIQLAQHFSTDIISADSRQCFKELNIGVAKPSSEELKLVKHYFINSHSIQEEMNTAIFEQYALKSINEIFKKNDIAIMVGGTGLYVKTFCHGIDEVPKVSPEIKEKVIADYEWEGLEWLQKEVEKVDPLYYAKGENKNPTRLIRALEVKLSTGKSILDFQMHNRKKRDFDIIKIGLDMPREVLYDRINARVNVMMQDGLEEEVKSLEQYKKLNALQTVGYRELFSYLEDDISLEYAVQMIKQNTRNYAKRQLTWFKADEQVQWCDVDLQQVLAKINL